MKEKLETIKKYNPALYEKVRIRCLTNQDNLKEMISGISIHTIEQGIEGVDSYEEFVSILEIIFYDMN